MVLVLMGITLMVLVLVGLDQMSSEAKVIEAEVSLIYDV